MIPYLFSTQAIVGTIAIAVAVSSIVAKRSEAGRKWFSGKLGDDWKKKYLVRFVDWPLFFVGLIMIVPGAMNIGRDILAIAIAFALFIVYNVWRDREKAKQKEAAKETGTAASGKESAV